MRVGLVGHAVGRPARVADADRAVERLALQAAFEIDQLAFGAAAGELAALDGGDAGRVIAAIFEPLQRIDDERRDRRVADNSNNSAHAALSPIPGPIPPFAVNGYLRSAPTLRKSICVSFRFSRDLWHGGVEIALPVGKSNAR